ncbi:MAG: DEAD/DEAH box helicase, partial [Caulobacteraceae bacterium]
RAGRKGDTFMLVTPADEKNVDKVTKLIGMNPDEVTLDTGAVEGGARGGGRGRGAKPERAAKPEREAAPEPEPIAAEAAPDSNDGEEIRERPARRRRGGRGAKEAAQPAAEAPAPMVRAEQAERPLPAPPAPRQSEGRGRGRGDRSEARDGGREASGVVGFGDDVPAFLRR